MRVRQALLLGFSVARRPIVSGLFSAALLLCSSVASVLRLASCVLRLASCVLRLAVACCLLLLLVAVACILLQLCCSVAWSLGVLESSNLLGEKFLKFYFELDYFVRLVYVRGVVFSRQPR